METSPELKKELKYTTIYMKKENKVLLRRYKLTERDTDEDIILRLIKDCSFEVVNKQRVPKMLIKTIGEDDGK